MFISIAVSSLINAIGLLVTSKLLNMALTLVQGFIVSVLASLVTLLFPEQNLPAFLVTFGVYLIALKVFTSESLLGVLKLAIVGLIITVALVQTGLLAALGVATITLNTH